MKLTIVALLLTSMAFAADKPYWASVAALSACTSADALTSYGHPELNPILSSGGRFGPQGVIVKFSITSGIMAYQQRNKKSRKLWTAINLASAGLYCGIAVRNRRLRQK